MEIWDLYDEQGEKTGETMIRGDKVPSGRYHRVVEALFLNGRGEILLQKRSLRKQLCFGILWYPTGGAVVAGESVEEACVREVKEELGFVPDMAQARRIHHRVEQTFIRDVYLIVQDVKPENMLFQEGEVDDARWLLPEMLPLGEEGRAFVYMPHLKEILPFLHLESMRMRIPLGTYRHYKGGKYRVTGLCLHSETLEPMVIYQALYGTKETWVRPAKMWNEEITVNGEKMRRFQKTDD